MKNRLCNCFNSIFLRYNCKVIVLNICFLSPHLPSFHRYGHHIKHKIDDVNLPVYQSVNISMEKSDGKCKVISYCYVMFVGSLIQSDLNTYMYVPRMRVLILDLFFILILM